MKLVLIVFTIIAFSAVIIFSYLFNKPNQNELVDPGQSSSNASPQPTPFLFEDLTIPYMRDREYKSKLGELKQLSSSSTYISYLTSYDSDGLEVNGLLTQPKGEKPAGGWPAIIFIHGYIPPSQYRTTQNYALYVDFLAKNGFVVFKIDLRGYGSSEGEPGGAYYSSDYIIDTLNAYAALQSSGLVNPKKIGLWGHSMAGNVVLRSIVAKKDIPASVIWAGAVYSYEDLAKYGLNDNSYRSPQISSERQRKRQQLFDTYGQFSKDSFFWKQVVPTNYLDNVAGAIEVHHALNDDVVSIEYSRNLMKLLDQTSIPHKLYEYQSGGHNIENSAFIQAMQKTVEFFNTYLK